MATQPAKTVIRNVKPLLSVDKKECRRRVMALYKAWYRAIPTAVLRFSLPITNAQGMTKLRQEFMKNKDLTDLRVIDMLVVKGQMELKEMMSGFKQPAHIMYMFKDTKLQKPSGFLSKFLSGSD